MTHDQIIRRLEELEADLSFRGPEFEQAAAAYYRLARDYEFRFAEAVAKSKASTVAEQKQEAVMAVVMSWPDYEGFVEAEASYKALKAAISTIETRVSIGQSLLRSSTREAGPQPQWSKA